MAWAHDEIWLRFVDSRPASALTTAFLARCGERLRARGVRVWVPIGENAAWHISREVQGGLRAHHRAAKRSGEVLGSALPPRRTRSNPRVVKLTKPNIMLKRPQHDHWPQPQCSFRQAVAVV